MSWPVALRSRTLWERGTWGVPVLSLAEGGTSDSLLASELSESDPEILDTSPARERKWSSAKINQQPPQNFAGGSKGQPTAPELSCPILHVSHEGCGLGRQASGALHPQACVGRAKAEHTLLPITSQQGSGAALATQETPQGQNKETLRWQG